jgi:CheY-like chemotaxis protein
VGDPILVVERDDTLRELLQDWLRLAFQHWDIVGARDAVEARSLAAAHSPRLILVDIDLPDRSGVETIQRLKTAVPRAEIVALAMDSFYPLRRAAMAAGATACVSKWRLGEELLPTLRDILHPEPPCPRKRTILCIDNVPEMIELIRLILERANFEVIGALTGCQGLKAVRTVEPDVVLLDLMMPDMDGWEVARRMKADDETRDIPIIAVTVVSPTSPRVRDLQVADFVTKPFTPHDLIRRVRAVA